MTVFIARHEFFTLMKSSFFCSHSRFMNLEKSYWSARKRTGQQ